VRRVGRERGMVSVGVTFSDLAESVDHWIRDYLAQVLGLLDR
jgi:hypothetical protein